MGSVLVKAPRPPLPHPPPELCKFCTKSGGGAPPPPRKCAKNYEGFDMVFCTFFRRGGGAPPPRMCKIGLAGEALYYYTLLYWGEGSGQYNYMRSWPKAKLASAVPKSQELG